jgi:hypothetical protein
MNDAVAWAVERADIHHERCRAAAIGQSCVACDDHERAITDAMRESSEVAHAR